MQANRLDSTLRLAPVPAVRDHPLSFALGNRARNVSVLEIRGERLKNTVKKINFELNVSKCEMNVSEMESRRRLQRSWQD